MVQTKRMAIEAEDATDKSTMDVANRLAFDLHVIPIMTTDFFNAFVSPKDSLESEVASNVAYMDRDCFENLRKTLRQHAAKIASPAGGE
jgi:hypothetical protein